MVEFYTPHITFQMTPVFECNSAFGLFDCGCLGSQSCGSAPRDTGQTHSICWKGVTGVQGVCVFEVYTHRHPHTEKWSLFE